MDNLSPSEARCALTTLFKELSMSHKELIDRHMDAIVAGDLDTLLSDYDDRSVIVSVMGIIEGAKAIRNMFENIPAASFAGYQEINNAEHDNTYIVTWKTDMMAFATDTFVIEDNKIFRQTFAFHMG